MIANLLKNGELYAAHQKYRTTAARLLKTPAPSSFGTGKSSTSSSSSAVQLPYDDAAQSAAELLYEGARALLEKGELGGGTDLSLYLLETWSQRSVPCTEETKNKVQTLVALVGGKGNWRKSIVDHAVASVLPCGMERLSTANGFYVAFCFIHCRWSANSSETPAGDSALHAYVGHVLYKGGLCLESQSKSLR